LNKLSKNKISYLTSLSKKKYRKLYKKFIIEGSKIIDEVLKSSYTLDSIIYEIGKGDKYRHLIELCKKRNIGIYQGKSTELRKISCLKTAPGICAVVNIREKKADLKKILNSNKIIAVNNLKDPGNLGTILRTAEWFGIKNILLDPGTCELYNPKVIQSTMGAVFHMEISENVDLINTIPNLKKEHYIILASSPDGESLSKFNFSRSKTAVVIGNESEGIDDEIFKISDYIINITGKGKIDSLNAAVSCGIIIWELMKNG